MQNRGCRDILDANLGVTWDDIAGLHDAKQVLQENCVLPLLMPQFFQGIRRPVKVTACHPLPAPYTAFTGCADIPMVLEHTANAIRRHSGSPDVLLMVAISPAWNTRRSASSAIKAMRSELAGSADVRAPWNWENYAGKGSCH